MDVIKGKVLTQTTASGEGANGPWKRVTVVVETANRYNNTVPVDFFNPEFNVNNGDVVEVDYFPAGWKHEGKYYAQLGGNAIRVVGTGSAKPKAAATATAPEPIGEPDGLPF